jgi:hypothetical protein
MRPIDSFYATGSTDRLIEIMTLFRKFEIKIKFLGRAAGIL